LEEVINLLGELGDCACGGIRVERWMDVEEEEIPDSLKIVIYRVLQEALNNGAKHSRADRVILSLKTSSEGIELAVEDKGDGLDPDNCRVGLGLGSMRERVELSGGRFHMESTIGKGTVIRAAWSV
jgi:signal transduction histidine kinase